MSPRIRQVSIALALAVPFGLAFADNHHESRSDEHSRHCRAWTDSQPSSLGADGWAAVDGPATGGCGAVRHKIFQVFNRSQLVDALNDGRRGHRHGHGHGNGHGDHDDDTLDHEPKIIYVNGTIDLNVDDNLVALTEEDYMRACNYTGHATFYDPVTHDQTGSGGFFGAYKAAYDPNLWIRQSLDPADNRPPALTGPLEEARLCFQQAQAERVVIDVGSNTSIIGVGAAARIVNALSPNHMDNDSSKPPARDPNRFDPRALPSNFTLAKLDTNTIPAKNTGEHKTRVDTQARVIQDSKNRRSVGTTNITRSASISPL